MRKPVAMLLIPLAASCLCGFSFAAGSRDLPHRYLPGSLDGGLQTVALGSDGSAVAAWAYRSGAEYDIAVSRSEAGGRWTEPTFLGADDGADQLEPALATDADGNVYVAYTDAAFGGIRVAQLRADGNPVAEPVVLRPRASNLSFSGARLLIVGEHVIVAFRSADRTQMLDLPRALFARGNSTLTITESGDPVEYRPGTETGNTSGPVKIGQGDGRPVEFSAPIQRKRMMDNY